MDHNILLEKLTRFSFSGNLYSWFDNYLTNRKQSTFIYNITSKVSLISHGVPQVSILGPMLFNLYINDLHTVISNKLLLYADNSVLYASSNSLVQLVNDLQDGFSKIVCSVNFIN